MYGICIESTAEILQLCHLMNIENIQAQTFTNIFVPEIEYCIEYRLKKLDCRSGEQLTAKLRKPAGVC